MPERFDPSAREVRLLALQLAASTRREVFLSPREDEVDRVAEQVLADAYRYEKWINEAPPAVAPAEVSGG